MSDGGSLDTTFAKGASTFDPTDIALKIGTTVGDDDSNTVTVDLVGGIPLAPVEHFSEFAGIPLRPESLYWITSTSSSGDDAFVTRGATSDLSGVGVAVNYNSSQQTDFDFFLNQGAPPSIDVAFQMEVSGTAVPDQRPIAD
jgi:hypothetical protein